MARGKKSVGQTADISVMNAASIEPQPAQVQIPLEYQSQYTGVEIDEGITKSLTAMQPPPDDGNIYAVLNGKWVRITGAIWYEDKGQS